MGTTTGPNEKDEGAVAEPVEDREGAASTSADEAVQEPTVVDLTGTDKPSRRFYANLADL